MKLFRRPTIDEMQKKLLREARENLVQAEALMEHYQHSVQLYRTRIARLEHSVRAAQTFAVEKRA